MSQMTYSFHSGSEEVTSVLQEPVTDPAVARRIGRQISEMASQRDATIIVRSHSVEQSGMAVRGSVASTITTTMAAMAASAFAIAGVKRTTAC